MVYEGLEVAAGAGDEHRETGWALVLRRHFSLSVFSFAFERLEKEEEGVEREGKRWRECTVRWYVRMYSKVVCDTGCVQ